MILINSLSFYLYFCKSIWLLGSIQDIVSKLYMPSFLNNSRIENICDSLILKKIITKNSSIIKELR